jgi:uncharacterized protein YecT (DUF1311 family)
MVEELKIKHHKICFKLRKNSTFNPLAFKPLNQTVISEIPMKKTLLTAFAFAFLLMGCAQRPPNCSDADILAAALENIISVHDEDSPGLRDYKQKVKLTDIEVAQNEQTKANNVCAAKATLNSPSGQRFELKMAFQTAVENGKAMRNILARDGFLSGVDGDMQKYVIAHNKALNLPSSPKTPEEQRLQAMSYDQLVQESKLAAETYAKVEQGLPANVRKELHIDEMNFKANQISSCQAAGEKALRKGLRKEDYQLICEIQSFNQRTTQLRALAPKEVAGENATQASQTTSMAVTPAPQSPSNSTASTAPSEPNQKISELPKPSFDCSRASTRSEKAICANARLAVLDAELAVIYRGVLRSNVSDNTKFQFVGSQKHWIAERDECTNDGCLEQIYRSRAAMICDDPSVLASSYKCVR